MLQQDAPSQQDQDHPAQQLGPLFILGAKRAARLYDQPGQKERDAADQQHGGQDAHLQEMAAKRSYKVKANDQAYVPATSHEAFNKYLASALT